MLDQHQDTIKKKIIQHFGSGEIEQGIALLERLHPADQAGIVERLSHDQQELIITRLPPQESADILEHLEDEDAADVVEDLDPGEISQILDLTESDVAADVLGQLGPEQAGAVLDAMQASSEVESLMQYAEDSAGGIMVPDYVALRDDVNVERAIAWLRNTQPRADITYYLYVVDGQSRLIGIVSLRQLIISSPRELIRDIMTPEVISVRAGIDQQECARLLQRYDLLALPVVDLQRRLIGTITVDDVVDIIQQEDTEDMYRMVGLVEYERINTPIVESVRRRLPWLFVNLATVFLAGLTVSLFEDVVAKVAVLAVFMPIIAGQSGNTGVQTLTIIARELALGGIRANEAGRALFKEVSMGLINGAAIGAITGLIAFMWRGDAVLALVVAAAIVGSMLVAALTGVLTPRVLKSLRYRSGARIRSNTDDIYRRVRDLVAVRFVVDLLAGTALE